MIIIWKPIAQTLYIKHRLFIMNKATSVQSFTYLGLVVSEKNVKIVRIIITIIRMRAS